MSSENFSSNPLDPVRKAAEEEYFHKQNRELAAKLKGRLELKSAGVQDQALADKLVEAGFNGDSLQALFLVPLIEVGWADGRLDENEKREILKATESRISKSSPAHQLVQTWLVKGPQDAGFQKARALVSELLGGIETSKIDAEWVLKSAQQVAKATGGLLGFGGKISAEEEAILLKIAQKFKK